MKPTPDDNSYRERFAQERERLLGALGAISVGGILEDLRHVGATSVPGLLGRPVVDIALAAWPLPLEESARKALESLGYTLDPTFADAPEQRFQHASGAICLSVVEAGSPRWTDFFLVREHLRHDEAARANFSAHKREWAEAAGPAQGGEAPTYQEAKRQWLDALLLDARQSWVAREGFAPLQLLIEEMRDFSFPWYIGGGWALDLFLGRVTRVHHDLDVLISRADQFALRGHLTARGWKLMAPYEGRFQPWPEHMRLELPRHQFHAFRDGAFIDVLLADLDGGVWRYRREPSVVRLAEKIGLRSDAGVPFLAPEIVLLFKSKNASGRERSKDQHDFEAAYASLEPERRAWLRWALIASAPSHPWIERL